MDVNRVSYDDLLRVPGIGVTSAKRILTARRMGSLGYDGLKKLGVVLKRAQYFITCSGKARPGLNTTRSIVLQSLMSPKELGMYRVEAQPAQLSVFDQPLLAQEDLSLCLTGPM